MFGDPLQLFHLIRLCIADNLGQSGASKTPVLHLDAVSVRPIWKALGVLEVVELGARPRSLVGQHRDELPERWPRLKPGGWPTGAKGRIEVDERPDATRIPIGEARDDGRAHG